MRRDLARRGHGFLPLHGDTLLRGRRFHQLFREGGTAYVSIGDKTRHGTIDVNIDGEVYQLSRGQIVPEEKILEIAEAFMNEMKLPECVEWEKI